MAKIIPITEHFQHFLAEMKESFWGDGYDQTKQAWQKRDYAEVKTTAQAIYLGESRAQAEAAFRTFGARWRREYGPMVRRLEHDLPELLSFFAFPRHRRPMQRIQKISSGAAGSMEAKSCSSRVHR